VSLKARLEIDKICHRSRLLSD